MKRPDGQEVMQFPMAFPIKAMGRAEADVEAILRQVLAMHAPEQEDLPLVSRASAAGRYVSVTVTLQARSREQLDAIYQALSDHPDILMAL